MNAFLNFRSVNEDVWEERKRQVSTWGDQKHPNGTGTSWDGLFTSWSDNSTWLRILSEEVHEAFAETDPTRLRHELVQVAAVVYAWIHDLDRTPQVDPNQQVLL